MKLATMIGFRKVFDSGRTKPILIEAVEGDGTRWELVAKITGKQFDKGALARELVASKLALLLGLDTPKTLLLEVPPNYVEMGLPPGVNDAIKGGFFPTFATEYIPHLPAFVPEKKLNERHLPVAAKIFTFDSMIVNRDRSEHGSVNCLTDSNRFVLIDHETALDAQLIGSSIYMEPWKTGSLFPMRDLVRHIFFDSLVSQDIDFTPIRDQWKSITPATVDQLLSDVPKQWGGEDRAVAAIRSYLLDLIENLDRALDEVEGVLA